MSNILKKCSVCKVEQSLDQFHKDCKSKDGLRCQCRGCRKAYQQTDNCKQYQKRYYDTVSGYINRLIGTCKDADRKHHRTMDEYVTIDDVKELIASQRGKCIYTDVELVFAKSADPKVRASIDRLDNYKGHVKGNVQLVSYRTNLSKGSKSDTEYREYLIKKNATKNILINNNIESIAAIVPTMDLAINNTTPAPTQPIAVPTKKKQYDPDRYKNNEAYRNSVKASTKKYYENNKPLISSRSKITYLIKKHNTDEATAIKLIALKQQVKDLQDQYLKKEIDMVQFTARHAICLSDRKKIIADCTKSSEGV